MVEAASLKGPDAKLHPKDGGQLSTGRLPLEGSTQQLGSTLAREVAQLHKAHPVRALKPTPGQDSFRQKIGVSSCGS